VKRGDYSSDVLERALALHHTSPVCDLHADTFIAVRYFGCDIRRRHGPPKFLRWNPLRQHCDLPRLKEGGVRYQGFGVVVPPWCRGAARFEHACATIRLMHHTFDRASDAVALATTVAEAEAIKASGRLAAFIGVEGAHSIDRDPRRVAVLRRAGVSYLGLCHFDSNDVVVSSASRRPAYRGMGPIGNAVVEECNRTGVIVDLAHCHEVSFYAALAASTAPAIVTHAATRALSPHHRNLSDDQLRALAEQGGVVGVIFFPWYLTKFGIRDDWRRVVDHVDHVAATVGPEYAALGSDFDGFVWTTRGLTDVSDLPLLTCELVARGYTDEQIRGILGGNFLRAWRNVTSAIH
jgi:membrane dipeptidase